MTKITITLRINRSRTATPQHYWSKSDKKWKSRRLQIRMSTRKSPKSTKTRKQSLRILISNLHYTIFSILLRRREYKKKNKSKGNRKEKKNIGVFCTRNNDMWARLCFFYCNNFSRPMFYIPLNISSIFFLLFLSLPFSSCFGIVNTFFRWKFTPEGFT